MNKEEAIELLKLHSLTHENITHPKMESGFLGILKPFKGELKEENFHEVMACIECLAKELSEEKYIEKDIISSIWGICHWTQNWTLNPNEVLQRNNLITSEQISLLSSWIDMISFATWALMDGCDKEVAFELYEHRDEIYRSQITQHVMNSLDDIKNGRLSNLSILDIE